MATPPDMGEMGGFRGFLSGFWKRKSVPPATPNSSPPQGSNPFPPALLVPPHPPPTPSDAPERSPHRYADVERGLCSAPTSTATAKAKTDDEGKSLPPTFHERMSDDATSIAGCLVALAFVLLLKVPTGVPPPFLCAYCYFAMLNLIAGIFIYYLHVARAPCHDVARVQAAAAALGVAGAVADGLVLCYVFLEPAQFWGLALALVSTAVGLCGFAGATGSI